MGGRISFLQLTDLNPYADQDFLPFEGFNSKSLWGKKPKPKFYHLFGRLKEVTLGTL